MQISETRNARIHWTRCSMVLMKTGRTGRKASLHATAEEGRIDVVKSLLERGEDVNNCNASNELETPLDRAAAKGKVYGLPVRIARRLSLQYSSHSCTSHEHPTSSQGHTCAWPRYLLAYGDIDHKTNLHIRSYTQVQPRKYCSFLSSRKTQVCLA